MFREHFILFVTFSEYCFIFRFHTGFSEKVVKHLLFVKILKNYLSSITKRNSEIGNKDLLQLFKIALKQCITFYFANFCFEIYFFRFFYKVYYFTIKFLFLYLDLFSSVAYLRNLLPSFDLFMLTSQKVLFMQGT